MQATKSSASSCASAVEAISGHSREERARMDQEEMKRQIREAISKPKYCVSKYYKRTGLWQAIARHRHFDHATLVVICINALWIAIDTDFNSDSQNSVSAPPVFQAIDHLFCTFFALEWFIRCMAFQRKRDGLRDGWFVFDGLLVGLMVSETWLFTIVILVTGWTQGLPGGTGILRLFRLLRLSRMMRLLRAFPELMILVKGMASATKSVFYVMCLLVIFLYVFAIAITQMAMDTSMGSLYFDTVHASMRTLMVSGVFFDNVAGVSDDIKAESYICLALWFGFILLGNFTVMNMLIGVLCEVVSDVSKIEKEDMQVELITCKLKLILDELDQNSDQLISKDEFRAILGNPAAAIALHDVGVDPVGIVDYADFIFDDLLGNKGADAEISFENFMKVVLQLRGSNIATVKDCVDVRKFIIKSLELMDETVQRSSDRKLRSLAKSLPQSCSSLMRTGSQQAGQLGDSCRETAVQRTVEEQKERTKKLEDGMAELFVELRQLREGIPCLAEHFAGATTAPNNSAHVDCRKLKDADATELDIPMPRLGVLAHGDADGGAGACARAPLDT